MYLIVFVILAMFFLAAAILLGSELYYLGMAIMMVLMAILDTLVKIKNKI